MNQQIKIIQENKEAVNNFINSLSKQRNFETTEINCVLTNIKNENDEIMYSVVTDKNIHNETLTEITEKVLKQHRITKINELLEKIDLYKKSLNKCIELNEPELQEYFSLKLSEKEAELKTVRPE